MQKSYLIPCGGFAVTVAANVASRVIQLYFIRSGVSHAYTLTLDEAEAISEKLAGTAAIVRWTPRRVSAEARNA